MLNIRPEENKDINGIRFVNEEAFGRKAEAALVDNLRKRKVVTLSLVAEIKGQIVGHILFSPVTIEPDGEGFNAVTLAPIAVLPAYQRQGIGSKLVREGLEESRLLGNHMVFLVGHAEYYPRFGFVKAAPEGFKCEVEVPDEAWMVLKLQPDAPPQRGGTVYFRPEFRDAM